MGGNRGSGKDEALCNVHWGIKSCMDSQRCLLHATDRTEHKSFCHLTGTLSELKLKIRIKLNPPIDVL